MAVKIMIPTPLRQYVGKKDQVEVEAKTVAEALSRLTGEYSELRRHLYNPEGKLRSFVNVYLGDEDIRFLQREQTPLKEDDVLTIVPSIAGGSDAGGVASYYVAPTLRSAPAGLKAGATGQNGSAQRAVLKSSR